MAGTGIRMESFHTIEISNPAYERDGVRMITVKSAALGHRADISLFVPGGVVGPVALVVLLHGVYGSHWAWALSGGAHLVARDMIASGEIAPVALAMPSDGLWGDGSGYVRHSTGLDFERWIMDEVPAACALAAPGVVTAVSPLLLAGLSMGGYGALRLGAKHAARVRGISAHSAVTQARQLTDFIAEGPEEFGALDSVELDPFHWMQMNRAVLPPVRFDCGTEDNLLEANRELHRRLDGAGIEHVYEEFAGGHSWDYWHAHLRDTLMFFEKTLVR